MFYTNSNEAILCIFIQIKSSYLLVQKKCWFDNVQAKNANKTDCYKTKSMENIC